MTANLIRRAQMHRIRVFATYLINIVIAPSIATASASSPVGASYADPRLEVLTTAVIFVRIVAGDVSAWDLAGWTAAAFVAVGAWVAALAIGWAVVFGVSVFADQIGLFWIRGLHHPPSQVNV